MNAFRYEAIESGGSTVQGVIEAEDRRTALQLLGARGLFPSALEKSFSPGRAQGEARGNREVAPAKAGTTNGDGQAKAGAKSRNAGMNVRVPLGRGGKRVGRKDVTMFTREMSALLTATIPIPQALDGLGEEEENPALKAIILNISESVRKGSSFSSALESHPRLFTKLYSSMVRVGEEAGALPKVMTDLANLLEHEDEVRGEVRAALAYPLFVLAFGIFTASLLMTFVLPKILGMLKDMMAVLPLPTLILLKISGFLHQYWLLLLVGVGATVAVLWRYLNTTKGAEAYDRLKLRLPIMGSVFRAAALSRFARTLGTLAKSGVSLLPALKIVENTIGNRVLAKQIAQVAEEARGGHSLATPLRTLGIFPRTVVQMIDVGEETGRLDEMLLKVAEIEERQMRARTKTLISLLAPMLIVLVGAMIGFMVISLLLPIFKMSSALH